MSPGVGIAAQSVSDAQPSFCLAWSEEPAITRVIAITDMQSLDQSHLAPNMGNWVRQGIWFPLGHEQL